MAITSEPADVLNIRIVFGIFPDFVFAVLILVLALLVNVPVALGAHLGGANPLSTSTHASIALNTSLGAVVEAFSAESADRSGRDVLGGEEVGKFRGRSRCAEYPLVLM
jgi:hypothetical protein